IPTLADIPRIDPHFATGPNGFDEKGKPTFLPYKRDPQTLARDWALPGTVGAEHRLGGLEKSVEAGTVSYAPANHEQMVHTRAERVARIPVPDALVDDPEGEADLLVVGWGSSWGPITAAVRDLRAAGRHVAQVQLRTLNPLPANLDQVLHRYRRVIAPEVNLGQLALVLRAKYLVDVRTFSKVRGQPLPVGELTQYLAGHLDEIEQEARR
ncbi:MAG: 2-oxoglutarate ferredoxin oxidoreductase subunit alpha, partial [Propionibacterium sp.]|nr:2-oxoglutarate ferredoxin oxidoreductase subunit alpha [Propionibacterium sp.]